MIKWSETYELGITKIDDQHFQLVKMLNELSETLEYADSNADIYDDIIDVIEKIKEYTVYHFNTEEKLFRLYGYPDVDAHVKEHGKLLVEINQMNLEFVDLDQLAFGKKLLNFLINWLFKHIKGSDLQYKDFILGEMATEHS